MQFSEKWLRDLVKVDWDSAALGHELTMAGLEVDAITAVAGVFSGVVVAEVVSVEPHPNADRLRITRVNDGSGEPLQVVCGAANVRVGMKVPFARIGAQLPEVEIKAAKLRGVESFGMLCAAQELGLAESSDGLLELSEDAPLGMSIRDHLDLDDHCYEIGLTPNRGDCLSLYGLAREVGVLARTTPCLPVVPEVPARQDAVVSVSLQHPSACSRYVSRLIHGIRTDAPTPVWLRRRLERSGVRSISAVVDITNYVMLELGQPMHAFDAAKVEGGIQVRLAVAGEELTLLGGQTIALRPDTLVIADADKPLAIAGIMGGEFSGVSLETSDILLEAAYFDLISLAGQARSYGLHTDSSHRFERGVDATGQRQAIERATQLILEVCGGVPGPVVEKVADAHLPPQRQIHLRRLRIEKLLGLGLADAVVEEICQRLGLQMTSLEDGWTVIVPSWRFDLALEVDLIEELGRVYGYNRLPSKAPTTHIELMPCREDQVVLSRIRALLVDLGYQEAITYSFIDRAWQALVDPECEPLALANPISSDMSVMRTSLLPGLLKALQYNLNRQQTRVRLFECGMRFLPQPEGLKQQTMLSGVVTGAALPELWSHSKKELDFFDIKGNIEQILALGGAFDTVKFRSATHPVLHPGQCARIERQDQSIGWIGKLHPKIQSELGIGSAVYLFELEIEGLCEGRLPRFTELSRFPEVRRDIAFIIDDRVAATEVLACIRANAGGDLKNVNLFDVYQGPGVAAGRKSLALSMTWQHPGRTLLDEEVQTLVDTVVSALRERFEVSLRD